MREALSPSSFLSVYVFSLLLPSVDKAVCITQLDCRGGFLFRNGACTVGVRSGAGEEEAGLPVRACCGKLRLGSLLLPPVVNSLSLSRLRAHALTNVNSPHDL